MVGRNRPQAGETPEKTVVPRLEACTRNTVNDKKARLIITNKHRISSGSCRVVEESKNSQVKGNILASFTAHKLICQSADIQSGSMHNFQRP